ncbi:MAG: phytanoyl-CoA dioxygenase family protein [Candidatus Latescibacterota bacterium]|nr:phytanoyl-CoA dioxygenase family protein [Candidatus Latescibacterota bacterium]
MDSDTESQGYTYRSLAQAQIESFRRDGYLIYGNLLGGNQLEELRSEYDHAFEEARESARYRNLSAAEGAAQRHDKGADEEMLQIMQMCERSLAFRQLLYHEPILDVVEDLIGPNIQLFHDQALFKPANTGGAIHWHQDNAYWQCLPANLVSCWLTLDDVNVENGAMHLLPGSHLMRTDHERGDVLLDAADNLDTSGAVIVDLPAGGAMFHHCQTLHFTPPNRTERQRRAFAIHFMSPGTCSTQVGAMPVTFARPMLRMRV